MQAARVSDRIWSALARLRRDGPDNAAPPRILPADERAAWDLYSPVAGATARPGFVLGQVGQSLDGRIATPSGDATDVSGRDGLAHLHRCRALVDAVLTDDRYEAFEVDDGSDLTWEGDLVNPPRAGWSTGP